MEIEHWLLIVLTAAAIFVAFCIFRWKVRLNRGEEPVPMGLLNTLIGVLVTILGLAVGATLVATQLSLETFGPKVIEYRLQDPWLWGALAIYIGAILLCLNVKMQTTVFSASASRRRLVVDASVLVSLYAIFFTLPFTAAVLRGMEQIRFVEFLIARKDYYALEDHLRIAMNHGLIRQVRSSLHGLKVSAEKELDRMGGDKEAAKRIAHVGWSVGRYAAAKNDPESILVAFDFLVDMTIHCTNKVFRSAGDIFNETASNLHGVARESFPKEGAVLSTVAELDRRAAQGFLHIAEVKAEGRERNLVRALGSLNEALEFFSIEFAPSIYGELNTDVGNAYGLLAELRDPERNLHKSIAAYEKALQVRTFEAFPVQYTGTQNNLGATYRDLAGVRDKETNLSKAITALEQALRVYTLNGFPEEYAGVQNNLGNAYHLLAGVRDREANLTKAITAYEQALGVYTFGVFPHRYATTQNNLGDAFRILAGVRNRDANLSKAIAALEEALRVYTLEAFPMQYANAQNALGNVYDIKAGTQDKEANLTRAIAAYAQALRVWTFDAFPQQFAGTQNNLGIAYADLASVRDKEANLDKAISAFRWALRVYTPGAFPDWNKAMMQNLRKAEKMRGAKVRKD